MPNTKGHDILTRDTTPQAKQRLPVLKPPGDPSVLTREDALSAHRLYHSRIDRWNEALGTSGQSALRNLFLMNGGALVAMLAFTSTILSKGPAAISTTDLIWPMLWFSIGLAFATAASGATYLTNFCYISAAQSQTLVWEHPYLQSGEGVKFWTTVGRSLHVLTILLAGASLALFVIGFLGVKDAFNVGGQRQTEVSVEIPDLLNDPNSEPAEFAFPTLMPPKVP